MKHTWSENELAFVSQKMQRSKWYLAIHKPVTVGLMEIGDRPTEDQYPIASVSGLAAGTFEVQEGMTAWIGRNSGLSDLGRARVRRSGTISGADVIHLHEGGSGLINWREANWVTIKEEYRPWVKHVRKKPGDNGDWFMDYDLPYQGEYEHMPPQVNMGAPFIGFLNGGTISGSFVGDQSISLDDEIIEYWWQFPDGQIHAYPGTASSPLGVTFTGASPNGRYYSLRCSTGASTGASTATGRRLMWTFNSVADLPRVMFSEVSGGVQTGGYVTRITAFNLDESDLIPGAEVVIFEASSYGNTASPMGGNSPFRNNIVFRGWITDEQSQFDGKAGTVTFTAQTINGMMDRVPSYDTFYRKVDSYSGSAWVAATQLNLDRVAIKHLAFRSTVGKICDFFPASGLASTEEILAQDLPRGTWWGQLRTNYYERGLLWSVSSDMQSAIHAFQDPNITGASASYDIFPTFAPSNFGTPIGIAKDYHDQAAQVQLYAVTSDLYLGAESPGNVLGYAGGEVKHEQGLLIDSRQRLIQWAGNWRAKLNANYKSVITPLAGNMKFDVVPYSIVPFKIPASINPRRLNWDDKLFIPQELNLVYKSEFGVHAELTSEEVVQGIGGSSIDFPPIIPVPPPGTGDSPPPPGPSVGSGDTVYVMGNNSLRRTREFSANNPFWGDRIGPSAPKYYDFILDPWDPVNKAYIATTFGLYKTTNLNSDSPTWTLAVGPGDLPGSQFFNALKLHASINVDGWIGFAVQDGLTTRFVYTYDRFATFNVATPPFTTFGAVYFGSADYVPHIVNGGVNVYLVVQQQIDSPPQSRNICYRSQDGGATWTYRGAVNAYTADPVGDYSSRGWSLHCPYGQNEDGLTLYFAGARGAYKSSDGGVSWTLLSPTPIERLSRHSVETYPPNKQQVQLFDDSGNVQVSENGGTTWNVGANTPGTARAAGGFPFDNGRFYLVTTTGIYASTDRGATFATKSGNFPISELQSVGDTNRCVIVPVWVE
jgi:hypothetical protein